MEAKRPLPTFSFIRPQYTGQLVAKGPFQALCAGPTGLCLQNLTEVARQSEGHLSPSLPIFPFAFLSPLPSFPQKPLLFQWRGKYFRRVVETGLLFFFLFFFFFQKDRKFLFIGKVVCFQRHHRAHPL